MKFKSHPDPFSYDFSSQTIIYYNPLKINEMMNIVFLRRLKNKHMEILKCPKKVMRDLLEEGCYSLLD